MHFLKPVSVCPFQRHLKFKVLIPIIGFHLQSCLHIPKVTHWIDIGYHTLGISKAILKWFTIQITL